MTVYELRQKLANVINQNKQVVIKQSNAINFGDNAPIYDMYEKDGVVYIAPPESIRKLPVYYELSPGS